MTRYRQVLAVPGVAALLGVSLFARTAITADTMALTLYVVLGLGMSYAAAGGVAAALTVGVALGGPLLGRMIDRRGLRPVLLLTVALQLGFWVSVPVLPYPALLGAAFVAGLLMVPAMPVTRLAITALTAPQQRQAAFALEAVHGELAYLIGPAVAILSAAQLSPSVVVWGVGAAIVVGGVGIALLNPPLRAADETTSDEADRPSRRHWLNAGMLAVLTMAFGVATLLSGVDLAIVATLEEAGQVAWASMAIVVLAAASITGGLIYGALPRPLPIWLLLGLLGIVTIPAGLASDWRWLCVAMVGVGLLTAPTLSTVSNAVSRLAPAEVRGEATGLQSTALNTGFTLGSPLAGVAVDISAPVGGFAAAGLAGLATATAGYLLSRRAPGRSRPTRSAPVRTGASRCEPHRPLSPALTAQGDRVSSPRQDQP